MAEGAVFGVDRGGAGSAGGDRPNVVLIVADDLDAWSYETMSRVGALLGDAGTTFSRYFVTTPICCPSRASMLRGQYAHNHGVLKNGAEQGGFHTFHMLGREESTLATWLRAVGYRTALVGKYLNGYPKIPRRYAEASVSATYVPPGWDEWYGQVDRGAFAGFDYELNENGRLVGYGDRPDDYLTDVLGRHARDVVRRAAADDRPFFLYLATLAPHFPAIPAPRHAGAFGDAAAPRRPSFDEADVSDKPGYLREAPRLAVDQVEAIDEQHRQRLRSLLAVDELVGGLVEALAAAGVLDRTYVILTSDHGWHAGEHRIPFGKQTPYEEAIRAPLLVRGPGVARGRREGQAVLNVDLAPTIAALAEAPAPDWVDGRSLVPLLGGAAPSGWRRSFLVEHLGLPRVLSEPGLGDMPRVPTYQAVRTATAHLLGGNLLYVEYEGGERELYDLEADPHQLENGAARAEPGLLERLSARLRDLRRCAGPTCREAEDEPLPLGLEAAR